MNAKIAIDTLIKNRLMENVNETDEFEKAFCYLVDNFEISNFELVCYSFHDKTNYKEIMFGLVHLLEEIFTNNKHLFINKLLNSYTIFSEDAKFWYYILLVRLLNSIDKLEFKDELKTIDPETSDKIILLLDLYTEADDEIIEVINYLKS